MVSIKGYERVDYETFQTQLHKKFVDSDKSNVDIASEVKVKTPVTVKNAFRTDKQIVSDEILTAIMNCIGLDGNIVWSKRERMYYISTKK